MSGGMDLSADLAWAPTCRSMAELSLASFRPSLQTTWPALLFHSSRLPILESVRHGVACLVYLQDSGCGTSSRRPRPLHRRPPPPPLAARVGDLYHGEPTPTPTHPSIHLPISHSTRSLTLLSLPRPATDDHAYLFSVRLRAHSSGHG